VPDIIEIEDKRAEDALFENEERHRTLFDLAPVAVYPCAVSGVIRDYNNRAAELWSRKPELGDTDERFCGSFKLYRPDGSFMPHEQCPVGDVPTGKVPGTHDAEVPRRNHRVRSIASTMSPSARRLTQHCARA
jgi:PAS domain-containing protein